MLLLANQSFLPNAVLAAIGLVGGFLILFWLWVAVDCLLHEPEATQKSAWLLVILFGNWIGALLYFFIRRRERLNSSRGNPRPGSSVLFASSRPTEAASNALNAEVISTSNAPPVTASAIARPSDWTLLRLLLVVFGVLVVLPTALGVVAYGIVLATFVSSVREDNPIVREQRRATEDEYTEFQKRVAEQRADFQKRVAEQETAHKKRASMSKVRTEPTGIGVTADTPLAAGDEVLCSWGAHWYLATVLEVQSGGVRIHWQNWDDFFDEVVPRERLQLAKAGHDQVPK